jgi:GNAT superfamily N-acetyltransferase
VGYATWFHTYSTFLARPTMYLEDLFVLESERKSGAGSALFEHVRALGAERGCGRMEWTVLDWNTLAREFYARRHATWMKEWLHYRVTY